MGNKLVANNRLQGLPNKVCRLLNRDVGHKKMNAKHIIAILGLLATFAFADSQLIIPGFYDDNTPLIEPPGPAEYWEQFPGSRPPMEMEVAYEQAKKTLEAFNQDTYCIESHLTMAWTGIPGKSVPYWWFHFGTTQTNILYNVWVKLTGEISLEMSKPDKDGIMRPYKPQDWLPKYVEPPPRIK